jgi:Uma2 family endonuclease
MTKEGFHTVADLLRSQPPNKRTELIRGAIMVREPAGYQHGHIAARLAGAIHNHVEAHALGRVFAAETGFILAREPDTVRAADVAFISSARLPEKPPCGFAEIAPDLAVEVSSPDDFAPEVLEKVADWLKAGTKLIWVVDPIRLNARVYRADGSESLLGKADVLNGEDVLPQFRFALGPLFQ